MANVERGFEIGRLSLELSDDTLIDIVAVPNDLLTVGFVAPLGSLGLSPNGKQFRKVGLLDTEWSLESQGVLGEIPFCLADGTPANISLVNGEIPFCLANGTPANIGLV